MKIALFVYDAESKRYIPANKAALAATAIISNRMPRESDMVALRSKGFDTRLFNGQPIGKVDVQA